MRRVILDAVIVATERQKIMKNIWLLVLIVSTALKVHSTEAAGQKDFALQLLQQGDVVEGNYEINPHIRPVVAAYLKKIGLETFFTSKNAALEGECITLRIPIATWNKIVRWHEVGEWSAIILKIIMHTAEDIGLTVLATYGGKALAGDFNIASLKEDFYANAPLIAGIAYSVNNLRKRITNVSQRGPLRTIIKVTAWADNTVVIKVPELDTILSNAKRDVLPQGVWVTSATGIPRIVRK